VMGIDRRNGGPTTASRQTYVTGSGLLRQKNTAAAISASMAEKYDVKPDQVRFDGGLVHIRHSLSPHR
jgi:hypothetical protein